MGSPRPPPSGAQPAMNEKNYWYAVLENAEDDWYYGNIDLEEAMRMCKESGPEAFIAVGVIIFINWGLKGVERYFKKMRNENEKSEK